MGRDIFDLLVLLGYCQCFALARWFTRI